MIDKKNVMRIKMEVTVAIGLRVPASASDFMKQQSISPTRLFMEALREVGYTPLPIDRDYYARKKLKR